MDNQNLRAYLKKLSDKDILKNSITVKKRINLGGEEYEAEFISIYLDEEE